MNFSFMGGYVKGKDVISSRLDALVYSLLFSVRLQGTLHRLQCLTTCCSL